MRVVFASIVMCVACDGSSRFISDDMLIKVDEGTLRTIDVLGARSLVGAPAWAQLDGEHLKLQPPCWAVEGFAGPPALVSFEVVTDGGTQPMLVQVFPSGSGECKPFMRACILDSNVVLPLDTECDDLPLASCATTQTVPRQLAVKYPDLGISTRVLRVDLDQRCDADGRCDPQPLVARPTSDAPIMFHPIEMTKTSFCAMLPNNNIVGAFEITYDIKPGKNMPDPDATSVGAGGFRLDWTTQVLYGLEVAWCAASSPCRIVLETNPNTNTERWCLENPTGPTSVGLRVWATKPPGSGKASFTLSSNDSTTAFTSTSARGGGSIPITVDQTLVTQPELVTTDLGAGNGSRQLTLSPTPPDINRPPFVLDLVVKTSCL